MTTYKQVLPLVSCAGAVFGSAFVLEMDSPDLRALALGHVRRHILCKGPCAVAKWCSHEKMVLKRGWDDDIVILGRVGQV